MNLDCCLRHTSSPGRGGVNQQQQQHMQLRFSLVFLEPQHNAPVPMRMDMVTMETETMGLTVKSSKMFLCGKLNEELNKYKRAHSASAQPASKNQAPCFEEYEFSDFSKKEFKLFLKSQKI